MTNRAKLFKAIMSFPEGDRMHRLNMFHNHPCKNEKDYVWHTIYSVMDKHTVKRNLKQVEADANLQFVVNEFNLTE